MLMELDVHALKRLAHSTRELSDLIEQGPSQFPTLRKKFRDHHKLILVFVNVADSKPKKECK